MEGIPSADLPAEVSTQAGPTQFRSDIFKQTPQMPKTLFGKVFLVLIILFFIFGFVFVRRIIMRSQLMPEENNALFYKTGGYNESIVIDGRKRTYFLYIPQKFDLNKKYSLVLVLHGGGGDGKEFNAWTGFSDKADKEGFIVVFPDGVKNNWADGRNTAEAEKLGVDDVGFMRKLVDHLQSKLPIDEKRIYATGASNGGMMSYRLGCEAADIFSAIGTDIANLPTPLKDKCNPVKPISLITINGLNDPLVPYEGGECCGRGGDGGEVLSTLDSVKIFAEESGCNLSYNVEMLPKIEEDGTSVEKHVYKNCSTGKDIVSYVILGMGHTWPPRPAFLPRISGPTSKNINATDVIWDFFEKHSR